MTLNPTSFTSILILSSHLCLGLSGVFASGFFLKPCMHISSYPNALHAPPISFFFTWPPELNLVSSAHHKAMHITKQCTSRSNAHHEAAHTTRQRTSQSSAHHEAVHTTKQRTSQSSAHHEAVHTTKQCTSQSSAHHEAAHITKQCTQRSSAHHKAAYITKQRTSQSSAHHEAAYITKHAHHEVPLILYSLLRFLRPNPSVYLQQYTYRVLTRRPATSRQSRCYVGFWPRTFKVMNLPRDSSADVRVTLLSVQQQLLTCFRFLTAFFVILQRMSLLLCLCLRILLQFGWSRDLEPFMKPKVSMFFCKQLDTLLRPAEFCLPVFTNNSLSLDTSLDQLDTV